MTNTDARLLRSTPLPALTRSAVHVGLLEGRVALQRVALPPGAAARYERLGLPREGRRARTHRRAQARVSRLRAALPRGQAARDADAPERRARARRGHDG